VGFNSSEDMINEVKRVFNKEILTSSVKTIRQKLGKPRFNIKFSFFTFQLIKGTFTEELEVLQS
jgi:hypothetical protein